jgi:hypothetical protein
VLEVDVMALAAPSTVVRLIRVSIVLFLATVLGILTSPAPVSADDELVTSDSRDPDARLQIVIRTVQVLEDRDPGVGESKFRLYFWRVNSGCPPDSTYEDEGCTTLLAGSSAFHFKANEGETQSLNWVIPEPHSEAFEHDGTIGHDRGIPVRNGQTFGLVITGEEEDDLVNDHVGTIYRVLAPERNWDIGMWTDRGLQSPHCTIWPPGCPFAPLSEPADTIVTYEIRQMPLPDLTIEDIRYLDVSGQQFICPVIVNRGDVPSGVFPLTVRADRELVKSLDHLGPLSVGGVTDPCIPRSDLPAASHLLSFRLDEDKQVPESQERNNLYEHRIEAISPASPASGTGPASGPVIVADPMTGQPGVTQQADLVLTSVKLSVGQACEAGKNDIAVAVKNQGAAATTAFSVRLSVDDDDEDEKAVAPLDAGKELLLAFDDVRLKEGERRVVATVDAKKSVTESDEQNNERVMTLRCEEDD